MAFQFDTEKALPSGIEKGQEPSLWKRKVAYISEPRNWKRTSCIALLTVATLFFTAQSIEGTVRRLKANHDVSYQDITDWPLAGVEGGPTALFSKPVKGLDAAPYVSLAASTDPDFNRQVYDLTSDGVLRIRKSAGNTTEWTEPEIIPTDPTPKLGSPLTSLAWRGPNGASNIRVYYLDASNRMVELASLACNVTTTCEWYRNTYFTAKSSGGLAAAWLGDADGLRLFHVTNSILTIAQWYRGSWKTYSTGLTVAADSPLSLYTIESASVTNQVSVLANVGGALKELVWKRARDYVKFFPGRTIDPAAPPAFASTFAAPNALAYSLNQAGVLQRSAPTVPTVGGDEAWGPPETTWVAESDFPTPPGIAVAALTRGQVVDVFYAALGRLLQLSYTNEWEHVGHFG